MSYQVLARKWRPRSFQELVGQESTSRILSNALDQQRIHHAYLFTGTRGVGKTTLARIIAKALNCEVGVSSQPCGQCPPCQAIDAGRFLDFYEIDAASRTKVEDTRELLDNVPYPPTQGRYKIYLIDEVHMLSNHSFNALLKTLEEPPEHVKFLLATTDPKRLPATILSRCLQFHLKSITPEHIAKQLQHICNAEAIRYQIPALEKLSRAADGSMRDALSLLDQAIAFGKGSVDTNEIAAMLGSIAKEDLLPLLEALAELNAKKVFDLIKHLAERSPDFDQVMEEMISLLHQIAVLQILPSTENALNHLATLFSPEDIQLYYQIALLSRRDLSLAPSPQQGFEMAMIRMLAFKPNTTSHHDSAPQSKVEISQPVTPVEATPEKKAVTSSGMLPEWRELLPQLKLSGMAHALASNCTLEKIEGDHIALALSENHQPMLNPKLKDRIEEALNRHLNKPIQLVINLTSSDIFTPIKQEKIEKNKRLESKTQSILQNPQIQKLIERFDATIDVSLV